MILDKQKWGKLRSPKDSQTMSDNNTGYYPEAFNRAFRTGVCNDDVFKIMAEFYKQKGELVKEYL